MVRDNMVNNAGLTVLTGPVVQHVGPLKPGGRGEIVYLVQPNTAQVQLTLSNVTPSLPRGSQNRLFGDDVLLTVHSAKTSNQPTPFGDGDYIFYTFTLGGSGVIANPEAGLIRITLTASWTTAGTVSADVTLASVADPMPRFTKQGKVGPSDLIEVPIMIGPGVSRAEFRLIFREDWSNYPVSDIDLILIQPDGRELFGG